MHLIKLSVGSEDVADLTAWHDRQLREGLTPFPGHPCHVTRMWPKRAEEILAAGGAIYWVIARQILCRQRIAGFERLRGEDGIERCAIVLDRPLIRTRPVPRRPFQGWRYLRPEDAPDDLPRSAGGLTLPPGLAAALDQIGVR